MPISDSPTLGRSHGPGVGLRRSGNNTMPPTTSTAVTGTLIKNTDPHQKCCSSAPPTTGPSAAPAENIAAQIPTAMLRSRGVGNRLRINASVAGANVAPATPRSARAPISISAVEAYAVATDMAPKAVAPQSNTFWWPMRSPRLPIVTSRPASTNE